MEALDWLARIESDPTIPPQAVLLAVMMADPDNWHGLSKRNALTQSQMQREAEWPTRNHVWFAAKHLRVRGHLSGYGSLKKPYRPQDATVWLPLYREERKQDQQVSQETELERLLDNLRTKKGTK